MNNKKRIFNAHARKSAFNSSFSDLISEVLNSPKVEMKNKHSKNELEAQEAQKVEDQIGNDSNELENDIW
jgi:hypothetical protein